MASMGAPEAIKTVPSKGPPRRKRSVNVSTLPQEVLDRSNTCQTLIFG